MLLRKKKTNRFFERENQFQVATQFLNFIQWRFQFIWNLCLANRGQSLIFRLSWQKCTYKCSLLEKEIFLTNLTHIFFCIYCISIYISLYPLFRVFTRRGDIFHLFSQHLSHSLSFSAQQGKRKSLFRHASVSSTYPCM